MASGVYQQYGEIRRIALEMALDRFNDYSAGDDDILTLAESFFQFLTKDAG
jgi:hypothetical protein